MGRTLGLVVLDTLRYDAFRDRMEGVAGRGVREFGRMYSTGRWTAPAHASLFTGYYPSEVGVHAGQPYLSTPEPVLAERLRNAGYETVALTENVNVDAFFEFDRGFDRFHRSPGLRDRPSESDGAFDWRGLERRIADGGLRRPLEALVDIVGSDAPTLRTLRTGFEMYRTSSEADDTIDWMVDPLGAASRDADDLFVFANVMTPHYPYDPPEGYVRHEPLYESPMALTLRDEPVTEAEHERHYGNYLGACEYLDDALPELLDAVEWDLLFVVSDHGELFGEHDIRGHQYGVYEELVHVPAVALGSLVEPGTTDAVTSLLDVHRTLLAAAGLAPDGTRGVELLAAEPPSDRAVYAESVGCEWYGEDASGLEARIPSSWNEHHYMVRTDDAMLRADKDGVRTTDPEPGDPVRDRRSELRDRARRIRAGMGDYGGGQRETDVPTDVAARLEELGYRG